MHMQEAFREKKFSRICQCANRSLSRESVRKWMVNCAHEPAHALKIENSIIGRVCVRREVLNYYCLIILKIMQTTRIESTPSGSPCDLCTYPGHVIFRKLSCVFFLLAHALLCAQHGGPFAHRPAILAPPSPLPSPVRRNRAAATGLHDVIV